MSQVGFSGRLTNYFVGVEAVRGTGILPTNGAGGIWNGFWLRWETADFFDTATTILNPSALNTLNKYSSSEVVEKWGQGQIAGKITDHAFGVLLYGLLGGYAVTTHAGESGGPGVTEVLDHTFTQANQNTAPTITIVRQDPNTTFQYTKGVVNHMSIEAKVGDFVRHTTTFLTNPSSTATTPNTSAATQTVTYYPSENEFAGQHCSIQVDSLPIVPTEHFKLDIMNNAVTYFALGSISPNDIYNQAMEAKGEFTLRYSDQTYYNLRFNNTPQSVTMTIKNTDVVIGTGTNPSLTFFMPQCYLTELKVDNAIDGIVKATLSFQAVMSLANGFTINSTLVNQHSTYLATGIS